MFTGIVEEIGTVREVQRRDRGYALTIACATVLDDTRPGDSLAVNGVCLTVTHLGERGCTVGLSPETRSRTNLASLKSGTPVNLERSVTPTTRLGGHFVQGHVDGTGTVQRFRADEDAMWATVQAEPALLRYVVPKGYVALDGVSLTVVEVGMDWFTVTLVAYTQQHITLPRQQAGYRINIEVDILGKYVEKMLMSRDHPSLPSPSSTGITFDMLAEHGYV
ncbi:MAG: riboflavin synthase [Chloroflexaceae bacterium]|nr:riboflavin synthase [Chloroflexaceae bacterium]